MRDGLPETMHDRLAQIFAQYQREKSLHDALRNQETSAQSDEESDQGGIDTFFAWFFRGEGPRGVVSGANIQQRFIQRGAAYATFFAENYVAALLGCMPEHVTDTLLNYLNVSIDELRHELRKRSQRYLSSAKRHSRADRFEAVKQLRLSGWKQVDGHLQKQAQVIWHERFETSLQVRTTRDAPDIGNWLN